MGALEKLSGLPIGQRSSSAPVSFALLPRNLEEQVERSPFEAFAPIPADAGATVLFRVAEGDMDSARDMVCTAPSTRRAFP